MIPDRNHEETPRATLKGGVKLTLDECRQALDDIMPVVDSIGTTGIYDKYDRAFKWMKRYYPNWSN